MKSNVISLSDHARASSTRLTKSFALSSPPDTSIIRSTSPSDGVCNLVSIRDREALEAPTRAASSSKLSPARCRYDLSGWLLMAACYMDCNSGVNAFVASDATASALNHVTIAFMAKSKQGQHF